MVENFNIDDKISASWAKSYYSQVQSEAKKATAETERLNKVQQQISNNEIKTKYDKVISDANKLTTASGNAAVSTEKLTTAYNELNQASQAYANDKSSATAQDNLRAKFESFSNVLKTTQSDISSYKVSTTSAAESIVKSFDSQQITAQVDTASSKLKSFSNVTSDTKYSVETLTQNYKNLKTAITDYNKCSSDDEKAVSAQKVVSAYETLTTSINTANASAKSLKATFASDKEINNFYNKVQRFYNTNTACHKQFGNELQGIMTKLSSGAQLTTSKMATLQAEFTKIGVQAQQAGLLGVSAFDKLKNVMSKLSYYTSSTYIFMKVVRGIKSMLSSINDLDTALIDLKKTTTMTDSQLEDFYYTANDVAKQMGVTTEEIISQAAAWSRLGYSSEEAATQMAQYSSLFASISPDMDTDTATEGLVSIMKAFDIGNDDTEEVLDGIISKINIIGNTQAVSNTDIVDFLENCSSAMSEANNTLDETIALGTAATEITQDASAVGNALKTVSMRIRSYDEETESYSEDLENISGDIADLTKTANSPGGISLFTDEDKTQYKSTYQILSEISEIYDEMTDKNQAELLEKLAGKRQGQVIAAILNNFSSAESSIDSMADSAGNAEAEMSIIMDSLDYKLNALSETGVGIAQNLFQTDDMKAVVDGATTILGAIDSVTESLGLFGTIGVSAFATGVGLFIKNIAKYQTAGETLEASQVIQSTSTDALAVSLKGYSASAVEAAIAQSTLDKETIKAILLEQGYNEATAEATATTLASATATNAQTKAMNAANTSTAGFSTTLKGFVSSNSTLLVITGIIAACYGAYKAFDYFNVSLDEAKENLEDSVTAYEETTSELESLESELSDINSQIAEINAQDSISLTDEQELENLKAQSAELEYQIALYKEKASLEAEDVLDDAKEQAKKKVSAISTGDGKDGSRITQTEQLQRAMDYYYQSDAKKRNLEQAVTALESKDSLTADEELYLKDYKYKIDQLESQESNAENEALEMAENLEAVASAMQEVKDNGGTLSDEDLALLEEYNSLLEEYSTFTENKDNNINPDYNSIKDDLVEEFDSNPLELSFDFDENDVEETTEEAISKAQSVADDNSVEVDVVENLNNMDSYLTDGLDQLADIYSDVYDGDDFDWTSILNNDDFKDAFSGLGDSYENFISTIANSPSDISACQDAFNSLADAYLRNSGVLDDLTAETKDATIAFLEQKGIVNANEIVTNTLAGKEALLAATGKDLETATLSDVIALQKEGTASQDTINTLINLVGQKQLVNGTILDTTSDINNLIALGNAIGSTTKALSILNSVKSGAVGMGGMSSSDYQTLVDNATAEVNSILSNYTSYSSASYKYTGSSGSSSSGSSSSSSSTTALDKFETYCEKFFDWVEVRLDRLADKTEKWTTAAENAVTYSSQKSYYKKAISATTKEISANESAEKKYLKQEKKVGQKAVSLGLVSQKWVNSITKKIANGTLDISKYSEKQQTVIEEMQTWYDKAQDASDAVDDLVYSLSDLYEELMNIANTKAEDKVSALSDKLDILSLLWSSFFVTL